MMRTDRFCVLAHPEPDMPAARGVDLCDGHMEDLHQDLSDMDLLLRLTGDMVHPTRGVGNRRGAPTDASPPCNLTAIALTDRRTHPTRQDPVRFVPGVVARWAGTITRMHPWVLPAHPTVDWGLHIIVTHTTLLCRAPHAVPFAQDLHDSAHLLRGCAGEIPPPIGRHKAPHPRHPDRDCGGRLYPLDPTGHQLGVRCIDCGEIYDGRQQLRRLGLILGAST